MNCVAIETEFDLYWNQLTDLRTGDGAKKECKAALGHPTQRPANAKLDLTRFPLNQQHLSAKTLRESKNVVIS